MEDCAVLCLGLEVGGELRVSGACTEGFCIRVRTLQDGGFPVFWSARLLFIRDFWGICASSLGFGRLGGFFCSWLGCVEFKFSRGPKCLHGGYLPKP